MFGVVQDIRYAIRTLARAPAFCGLATLVLAVGIGATSTIFSLIDGTFIRPLPFADPDRLVMLWEGAPEYLHNRVSPLNFSDWQDQNRAFSSMAAVAGRERTMTGANGTAEVVRGQSVTTAFFDVLGVSPIAGRTFRRDDNDNPNVVMVSERFWKTTLGGEGNAIGRVVRLDGIPFTVVGIVPAGFQVLFRADLWTPFVIRTTPEQRRQHYLQVLGKLKPHVTIEQARSDMATVARGLSQSFPDTNQGWSVTIEPLADALISTELRATVIVLGGVVAFVLLMACANVANLLLARGLGRTREIAVRAALGGSRSQLLRLLLTESMVLAVFGGAAGLAVSWAALRAAPSIVPAGTLPVPFALHFDLRVTLFAAAITAVAGIVAGLAPAWHAARTPLAQILQAGGRGATGGLSALRRALAVAELGAAVLLLSGAGLLVRTLAAMNSVDPGYHARSVLTMSINLPNTRYPTQAEVLNFFQSLERNLSTLPGVRVAALGGNLPLDGWSIGQPVAVAGEAVDNTGRKGSAHYQMVSPRYFEALDIPIREGRVFTEHDVASSVPVCIVNEEFVRRYLSGRVALDSVINVPAMAPGIAPVVPRRVVGVIQQVAIQAGEGAADKAAEIYVPLAQNVWYLASIVLQTDGNPMALAAAAQAEVARLDKDQPVMRIRTMEDVASEATSRPRFRAQIIGAFAVIALVLAAFGVLTFTVRERTREFGVRMALGAKARDILRLVLGNAVRMAATGVIIGLVASAFLTRVLSALLFGVTPLDPLTLIAAPAVLGLTALVACAVPAVRAARVDPAATLRHD